MTADVVAVITDDELVAFWCEGCRELHCVWPKSSPNPKTGASWHWNGDRVKPTFSPSVLVEGHIEAGRVLQPRCHSYVENGMIRYLTDCDHELAGLTVRLKPDPLNI